MLNTTRFLLAVCIVPTFTSACGVIDGLEGVPSQTTTGGTRDTTVGATATTGDPSAPATDTTTGGTGTNVTTTTGGVAATNTTTTGGGATTAGTPNCTTDTYTNYAQAMIQTHCGSCHSSYSSYSDVVTNAAAMQGDIQTKKMPKGTALSTDDYTRILKWFTCNEPM